MRSASLRALRQPMFRLLACLSTTVFAASAVQADRPEPRDVERETRIFRISVDGTERGQCTIQIRHRDDGTDWVGGNAGLLFNYYIYKYRFNSSGTAIFSDGRLLQMDRTANFNGTEYHVTASATPQGLILETNGRSSLNSPELWSTTCYQLPKQWDAESSNGARTVIVLDADKGNRLLGRLQRVGDETLEVAGEQRPCVHYRVTGDVDVHVWYDARLRLVRRQSIESGHKVLIDLVQIGAE
jgi:Family of unknown function (DUF6134)